MPVGTRFIAPAVKINAGKARVQTSRRDGNMSNRRWSGERSDRGTGGSRYLKSKPCKGATIRSSALAELGFRYNSRRFRASRSTDGYSHYVLAGHLNAGFARFYWIKTASTLLHGEIK